MEKNSNKTKKKTEMPTTTNPTPTYFVNEQEVDYKTRTVLLLDARNDLVAFFFGGLDVMAANFKPSKKTDQYAEYLYATCVGFIGTIREKSMNIMAKHKPEFGIGDIIKNGKGTRRLIINMFEDKDEKLTYSWVDPDDAKAPMGACAGNTMKTWIEKR